MSLDYQKEEKADEAKKLEVPENVKRVTPVTPYYSYILIACIVAVSISQMMTDPSGSELFGGRRSVILAGFDKQAFLDGQYWRILTGFALHGGLIHLGFNSYALYVLGKLVETLSNRAHLAIMFLLSAIGGNILSLIFMPNVTAIGASGGIIGFLGYMAVYAYYRRALLSNAFLKNMLLNIGFIALYGLALYQVIDNFGHLGGLLTGAIYGFFQIPKDLYKDPREVSETTIVVGIVAIGIFVMISILSVLLILRIVRLY